jgi:acetyltransferase-like isoleucine patch superfamily enzyme
MIKKIIKKILPQRIKYLFFIFKWRKLNKHNNVTPLNILDINKVKVDVGSYGPIIVKSWGAKNENLTIGKFCSISEGVKFILGGNHYIKQLSNFSFEHYFENNLLPAESKGPIIVEDGVWIGTDALILSGVTLGKG